MRKIVLAMMTTLNGRLDDPDAWVTSISDDHYQEIDHQYAAFDAILVGRTTYEEMREYWPRAGDEDGASEAQQSMAQRMSSYQKYVFTTARDLDLGWHNAEVVRTTTDAEIRSFVENLTAQDGADIHLSGGASLAQTIIRLGLVDEYRFFVYPVVSKGKSWHDQTDSLGGLELIKATGFDDGAAALYYKAI